MLSFVMSSRVLLLLYVLSGCCLSQDCNTFDILSTLKLVGGRNASQLQEAPASSNEVLALSDKSRIEFQPGDIFPTSCNGFPSNFCVRVMFKLRERIQKAFYIFTLTNSKSSTVILGLSLQTGKVVLDYQAKGASKSQKATLNVNTDQLADTAWHRLQICVVDDQAKLNVDCTHDVVSDPLKQRAEVDLTGLGFVGRKTVLGGKKRQSLFQGSIAALEIAKYTKHVESSFCSYDTTPSPSTSPSTCAELRPGGQVPVVFSEESQECNSCTNGNLWYDVNRSKMKVCDGTHWKCLSDCQCNIDYIEMNQTLFTTNASDTEFFQLPGHGLFVCVAQYNAVKGAGDFSIIFHLEDGVWSEYQRLPTKGAQDCAYFIVDGHHHVAVANLGKENSNRVVDSVIYRWNNNTGRFNQFASLPTGKARDSTFFCMDPTYCFLAVAKYSDGMTILTNSIIYRYHQGTFREHQQIATQGGYDIKYFEIDGKHFLAAANAFNGQTTHINSHIYKWHEQTLKFTHHQSIPTIGATDWEFFQIKGDSYLAVANSFNHRPESPLDEKQHEVDSVIYKFDKSSGQFGFFQSLTTYSASKWSYFEVCGSSYLSVANSYDEDSEHVVHSNIYRYMGVEKFVLAHSVETQGAVDWDYIHFNEQDFLSCANSKGGESYILEVKKTSCCN